MTRTLAYAVMLSAFIVCAAGCTGPWQNLGALLGAGLGATASSNADAIAIHEFVNATAGALRDTSKNNKTH